MVIDDGDRREPNGEGVATGSEPIMRTPSLDEPRRFVDEAKRRYLYDATFHARVEVGLQILEHTHDLSPDDDYYGLTLVALGVGLMMATVDPVTGYADKQVITDLIEASSLGTPGAKALRERTPKAVVDEIMRRVAESDGSTQ